MSQKPAFPMTFVNPTQYNLMGPDGNVVPPLGMVSTPGLTQRAYAAIALKVPASGEAWLDEMIREGRRLDLQQATVAALLSEANIDDSVIAWAVSRTEMVVNEFFPEIGRHE